MTTPQILTIDATWIRDKMSKDSDGLEGLVRAVHSAVRRQKFSAGDIIEFRYDNDTMAPKESKAYMDLLRSAPSYITDPHLRIQLRSVEDEAILFQATPQRYWDKSKDGLYALRTDKTYKDVA